MGRLTTHVLDTAHGTPGKGIALTLYRLGASDGERLELVRRVTNDDGRCDTPLLQDEALQTGQYELVFEAGDYFRARGQRLPEPLFVDQVVLRFGIADPAQHYHVPLLVSPWSYSTYRGS